MRCFTCWWWTIWGGGGCLRRNTCRRCEIHHIMKLQQYNYIKRQTTHFHIGKAFIATLSRIHSCGAIGLAHWSSKPTVMGSSPIKSTSIDNIFRFCFLFTRCEDDQRDQSHKSTHTSTPISHPSPNTHSYAKEHW